MKLLVDQNISHRLLPLISEGYSEVQHVKSLDLINADDHKIFMFARENNYDAVLTIDDDFVRLLHLFSIPPKVIWIRTGNCSTSALAEILLSKTQSIHEFVESDEYVLYEVFKSV
ncbi:MULTISPECIES: DUF5615 family PIN-like protein [Dyadobacter]|jgi:predicted nuclease of predicted toxin-antitoxin system|uniref:DUF5615 family PIN-like protein n=1 Tax=Dyadobacter chenhuakuii TaxID=2909339 RepID=A0A9X1U0S0_9BACT|nr:MULTISPECIES: DUF5615 family PIN-like protein [Dyadobacter]MCF2492108.1 DUF5615 family PIN-like protein [Dyadobacter chenhuakuii]MCF2498536.1 DUF5615 family PIN-like protein [Dyadobacter chenhuakuii]MCF2516749.1 DUF5615 family PIN-like protein [Dyadobacter sp. CY351]USJ28733.1 DUF5615 family PIN-like protein [Dyadobacter chenhuakuii]